MTGKCAEASQQHILVVDDDDRLRSLLRRYLSEQGFVVVAAEHAAAARALLADLAFDAMVLDVMMPGENGFDFIRSLRAAGSSLPVLLLTARGEPDDRITGLEAGADDYLPKPFEPRELLLRINAILRRVARPPVQVTEVRLGRWRFGGDRDELRAGDEVVRLTEMEASLLRLLVAEPGVALTREQIAARSQGSVNDRTIDVQITRLRRKIEPDPKAPRYILTVRGEGYMVKPDGDAL